MSTFLGIFEGFYIYIKELPNFQPFVNFRNSSFPYATVNLIDVLIERLFLCSVR